MIETITDLTKFQLENQQGDWFVHAVPMSDHHPVICTPSVLFIRNLLTGKTYYYAFNHPDSKPEVQTAFEQTLLSSQTRKWTLDKKAFEQMFWKLPNVLDANAVSWIRVNETFELSEYATTAHYLVGKNAQGHDRLNLVIPLLKHKEMFDELADDITTLVKDFEPDLGFIRFNELIIGTLGELEMQGIYVDRQKFKERYEIDPGPTSTVHSQYNVYTSTGRPSNRWGGVNYAALNQDDGTRKCFISRYGKDGAIVVLDYTTFHPRIISRLVKYDVPMSIDIYEYLAKLYFHKKTVDETDIKEAKNLTFRQFYGGIEERYAHIKYLASVKDFMAEQWELFNSQGYVLTPFFKRRITSKHVSDPNPPKVFNYILQATEGELSIPKVKSVLDYLKDKKTRAVLYTYDAVMYDFYKPDGMDLLRELKRIMGFDGRFPMKTYMGDSYQDVKLISLE
jgi:hypothetical protein